MGLDEVGGVVMSRVEWMAEVWVWCGLGLGRVWVGMRVRFEWCKPDMV